MNRHGVFGVATTAVIAISLVLGFVNLGGHGRQRDLRADQERAEHLKTIAIAVNRWYEKQRKLPPDLKTLSPYEQIKVDPITKMEYEYLPAGDTQYQLCAKFALEGRQGPGYPFQTMTMFHDHPAARHCFELDAVKTNVMR